MLRKVVSRVSLTLCPYQEQAYEAIERMLGEKGRAAVIHSAGTGKSYPAFKLGEGHPEGAFLWPAPAEYVFRAQLESLGQSKLELDPERVSFVTENCIASEMTLGEAVARGCFACA